MYSEMSDLNILTHALCNGCDAFAKLSSEAVKVIRSVNAPDLCTGGARFKCRLMFNVVYQCPSSQIQG
jgi:hypothetical protein